MGVVDLVYDRVRQEPVARKRIKAPRAASMRKFKREFRVIKALYHPGLIRLYELGEDADGLYFTMEMVEGTDLQGWCDAGDRVERLAHAFPQLLRALAFLHANDVIHRDLKPANVLVRSDGAVKLIDFGVLARTGIHREGPATISGTPGYIAPENMIGAPPSVATDLYALGVVLRDLTPKEGDPDMKPVVREQLLQVSRSLRAHEPGRRPSLEVTAVLLADALGVPAPRVREQRRKPPGEALDHREQEQLSLLRSLEQLARQGPGPLVISGPSGAGKTALADWLVGEAGTRGWRVLASTAQPTEHVPFNAIDAAVDQMANLLSRRRKAGEDIRKAAWFAGLAFPVLGEVAGVDLRRERVRSTVMRGLFQDTAEREVLSRSETFEALLVLLDAVATERRVLLLIDDAHWADDDSLTLLQHLVDADTERWALAFVVRKDELATRPRLRWLCEHRAALTVEITPPEHGSQKDLVAAAAAAATSPVQRHVAALVAASQSAAPAAVLAELSGVPPGKLDDALSDLERAGLVYRTGSGPIGPGAACENEQARAALISAVGTDDMRKAHAAWADRLLSSVHAGGIDLVRHLVAARRHEEAGAYAVLAARDAEQRTAFGLAAEMYRIALRAPGVDRVDLLRSQALALEEIGRPGEAAACWQELSRIPGADHIEARFREAKAAAAATRIIAERVRRMETIARASAPSLGAAAMEQVHRHDMHALEAADGSTLLLLRRSASAEADATRVASCALAIRSAEPALAMAVVTSENDDALRRSAALLQEGQRGTILIDAQTSGLLRRQFRIVGTGPNASLEGRAEHYAHRVEVAGRPVPFVGRSAELEEVQERITAAFVARRPGATLVIGEAGIGKTRLSLELARAARAEVPRAVVWQGGHSPLGTAPNPFAACLQAAAGISEDDPVEIRQAKIHAQLVRRVPLRHAQQVSEFLGELLDTPAPGEPGGALQAARRDARIMSLQIRSAIITLLRAVSRLRPILLVMDDLHWADPGAAGEVAAALELLPEAPIFVLGLLRPSNVDSVE